MSSKAWIVCALAFCGFTFDPAGRDALAQAPATAVNAVPHDGPRFEAVSIKRNTSTSGSLSTRSLPNGGYLMVNSSLRSLISVAYGTSIDAKSLPAWVADERYDVTATSPIQGQASTEQRQAMMRALLAERLNFKGRIEQREEEAFDLVLARKDGRLGPNMKRTTADCEARAEAQKAALAAGASPLSLLPPPGDRTGPVPECTGRTGGGVMEGDFTITSMLFFIRGMAGRQVIDKTGLKGTYTVRLETALRRPTGDSTAVGIDDPPDVFTALPSQLGLKLEPSRITVNTLVVENIDRPSEN